MSHPGWGCLPVARMRAGLRLWLRCTILCVAALLGIQSLCAQAKSSAANSRLANTEVAFTFLNDHGQVSGVPGQQPSYYLNGASASVAYRFLPHASVVAQFSGTHANNVGGTLSLTELTYLIGLRYGIHPVRRVHPFAQLMLGGVHATGGIYAPNNVTSGGADDFALTAGGGVDVPLSPALSVRTTAEYYGTDLPNGRDNRQNLLRLGLGVTYRFGLARSPEAPIRPVRARRGSPQVPEGAPQPRQPKNRF